MSAAWLAAVAGLALLGGVVGAVLFSSLSDDDDDDDSVDAEGTPDPLENLVAPPEITSAANIPADQRELAEETVADRGYELAGIAAVIDSNGDLVLAAVGIDEESLDGGGQRIFYFVDGDFRGFDWSRPVVSIESVTALESGQFRVLYAVYAEGNERCCPSEEPFEWIAAFDGSAENEEQPPESIFTGG